MRALAFSDWSVQDIDDVFDYVRSASEPIDAILYAGDDVSRFQRGDTNYFAKLAGHTAGKKVLAVVGNNDPDSSKSILQDENVVDLHEEPFVLGGFGFMGLEGAPFGQDDTHFESAARRHLKKQHEKIKSRKLVVVSHSPPHGVLDIGIRFAPENEPQHHTGSTALRDFIMQNDVHLVVCGHCHSQGGRTERLRKTMVANVSSHDGQGASGNLALICLRPEHLPLIQWSDTRQLIDPDSLMNLHSVGPARDAKFKGAGIKTISDLANIKDLHEVSQKARLSERLVREAQLRAQSRTEGKIIQKSRLVLPSNDLIFFDIETDLARKRVWLIGVLHDGIFTQFYAEDWGEEEKVLGDFLGFLGKRPNSTLVSYSCICFDRNTIHRSLVRQGLDADLFSRIQHVDLCHLIRQSFIFPNKSYGLKEIGKQLGYGFVHTDLDGVYVASEYQKHIEEKREIDRRVIEYNRDDVYALPYIIGKLEPCSNYIQRT